MQPLVIEWDGQEIPAALRGLPPGRYVVEPLDHLTQLTDAEEQGLIEAMEQADKGQVVTLEQALANIRAARRR